MKKTVSKKTNKELIDSLLAAIKDLGYTIKDEIKGNSYFVFTDEKDSICHFHIKEIPGFRFGIWNTCRFDSIKTQLKDNGIGHTWADSLEISPLSELVFFTQYERDLDKFKPSRSGFVTGLYRQVWEESDPDDDNVIIEKEKWNIYELEAILHFMKTHHMRSVLYAGSERKFIWEDEPSHIKVISYFISSWLSHWKYEFIRYLKYRKNKFGVKQLAKSLKYSYCFVIDRGVCWTPRFEVIIRRKQDIDIIKYAKEQKRIDKFEKDYFMGVSVSQYDVDITVDDITSEDLVDDRNLYNQFKERYEYLLNNVIENELDEPEDEKTRILYSNIKGAL